MALAGIYNRRRFEAALIGTLCNDGTISTNATTPCAPGTTRIFYNPFNGGTNNSPELLELLNEDVNRKGQSKLYSWDAKFNGALGKIGDRDVQWAFGAEVRREDISDAPSALATAGPGGVVPVLGFGSTAADAARTSWSVFAESLLPLSETLELRVAGRYDHYSDFGGDFNPAISLRWQPNDSFLIRGGWNTSFRAPSLAQVGAGTTTGVGRSTDGGRTWTATPLKTVGVTVAVYPKDPEVVAVVDDKTRFFRSSDGGVSWPAP